MTGWARRRRDHPRRTSGCCWRSRGTSPRSRTSDIRRRSASWPALWPATDGAKRLLIVMAGLVPAIHELKDVDLRDKPGDGEIGLDLGAVARIEPVAQPQQRRP